MLPICSLHPLSRVNHSLGSPQTNLAISRSPQGHGIGMAWAIALLPQWSPTFGVLQSEIRTERMDLSAVITWVGIGLSAAEPHAPLFMCTCQLDFARVSGCRSIKRFSTADAVQHIISMWTSLIWWTRLKLSHHRHFLRAAQTQCI